MCAGASPLENDQVVICATVQICALFRGVRRITGYKVQLTEGKVALVDDEVRRITGYKVQEAPPQVWKFITGSWFTPQEAQGIIEELIEYGYCITIKTAQEDAGVLEAVEWDEP